MLYTTDGKPVNPRDFFEINVYSLKLSKEFQENPNTTKSDGEGAASDDKGYKEYVDKLATVTKQIVSGADLLQIDQLEDTIYLPIPNSIEELISHNYKEDSLNVGEIAQGAAVSLGSLASDKISSKFSSALNKITNGKVTRVPNANLVSNLTDFAQHMMMRSNIILDPGLLLTYQSTNPRSFSFSFILMPQNPSESTYYKKAIDLLKNYSKAEEKRILGFLPTLKQDKIFTFNFGGIDNMNSLMNDLMRTDDSQRKTPGFFISNINLTVNSRYGYMQSYHDDMPIHMVLDLTFEERKPLFFKFWEDKVVVQDDKKNSEQVHNENIASKTEVPVETPKTTTEAYDPEARRQRVIQRAEEEGIKYESTPIYGN